MKPISKVGKNIRKTAHRTNKATLVGAVGRQTRCKTEHTIGPWKALGSVTMRNLFKDCERASLPVDYTITILLTEQSPGKMQLCNQPQRASSGRPGLLRAFTYNS